jgi:hypothetical protein
VVDILTTALDIWRPLRVRRAVTSSRGDVRLVIEVSHSAAPLSPCPPTVTELFASYQRLKWEFYADVIGCFESVLCPHPAPLHRSVRRITGRSFIGVSLYPAALSHFLCLSFCPTLTFHRTYRPGSECHESGGFVRNRS